MEGYQRLKILHDLAISLLGIFPELKSESQWDIGTLMFITLVFTTSKAVKKKKKNNLISIMDDLKMQQIHYNRGLVFEKKRNLCNMWQHKWNFEGISLNEIR